MKVLLCCVVLLCDQKKKEVGSHFCESLSYFWWSMVPDLWRELGCRRCLPPPAHVAPCGKSGRNQYNGKLFSTILTEDFW